MCPQTMNYVTYDEIFSPLPLSICLRIPVPQYYTTNDAYMYV